jgi:hypothetical protein
MPPTADFGDDERGGVIAVVLTKSWCWCSVSAAAVVGLAGSSTAAGDTAEGLWWGGETGGDAAEWLGGLAVWLLRGVSDLNADKELAIAEPPPPPGELREEETEVLREEEVERELLRWGWWGEGAEAGYGANRWCFSRSAMSGPPLL